MVLVLLTAGAVFVPGVEEAPLRIVFGLPFVPFLPGYAFIAARFPEAGAGLIAEMEGQRLRLAFLLYNGSVPANPTVANASRETHLWVNVSRGNAAG